jgi:hypothetical protein
MNKTGWFLTGIYTLGMMITIYFSYLNIGTINQRVLSFVLCIIGIGVNVLLLKEKELGEIKE